MEGLQETSFRDVVNGVLGKTEKEQLYKTMLPVVVQLGVFCVETDEVIQKGNGVFISPTGLILTISDVVSDHKNDTFAARTSDNNYICEIKDLDPNSGLALLQIKDVVNSPYAKVSERVTICEQVYSIGDKQDCSFSYSIGQVSHLSREYEDVYEALKIGREAMEYMRGKGSIDSYVSEIADPSYISSSLLQLNNLPGFPEGTGMPIFNYSGHVIGLYTFTSNEQCFAINAHSIISYLSTQVARDGDIPGSLRGTDEKEKKRKKKKGEKRRRKEELKEGTKEEVTTKHCSMNLEELTYLSR